MLTSKLIIITISVSKQYFHIQKNKSKHVLSCISCFTPISCFNVIFEQSPMSSNKTKAQDWRQSSRLFSSSKKKRSGLACSTQRSAHARQVQRHALVSFSSTELQTSFCSFFLLPVCHPHIWSGRPASLASRSHLIYGYLKSSDGFMCFEWIRNKRAQSETGMKNN